MFQTIGMISRAIKKEASMELCTVADVTKLPHSTLLNFSSYYGLLNNCNPSKCLVQYGKINCGKNASAWSCYLLRHNLKICVSIKLHLETKVYRLFSSMGLETSIEKDVFVQSAYRYISILKSVSCKHIYNPS